MQHLVEILHYPVEHLYFWSGVTLDESIPFDTSYNCSYFLFRIFFFPQNSYPLSYQNTAYIVSTEAVHMENKNRLTKHYN